MGTARAAETGLPPSLKAEPAGEGRYRVSFTFTAADVTEAFLVGDFNDWNRTDEKMTTAPGGVFRATVEMSEGDHEYSFYVDNRGYRTDPLNPKTVPDPVRGSNSAFSLGAARSAHGDELLAKAKAFVKENSGDEPKLLPAHTKALNVTATTTNCVVVLSTDAVLKPWRPAGVTELETRLGDALQSGKSSVVVAGRQLEEFVPPRYRAEVKPRGGPTTAPPHVAEPLRKNVSSAVPTPDHGLAGRNIVVWASHGWMFDNRGSQRWVWQRGRLFTSVEDLLPMSFVNPFLLPMLENAGAVVFNCRERDFQLNEAVLDDGDGNASPALGRFEVSGGFNPSKALGFRNGLAPFPDGLNPHRQGTTHESSTVTGKVTSTARWTPNIPEDGDYGVYISYASLPDSANDAHYIVHHAGGTTTFLINQQMAGNTWVWLGQFHFHAGAHADTGSVELTNESAKTSQRVSADAVKFGGGMGSILRGGNVSGYPRYAEAARYWFQYCGIDPKLIYAYGKIGGNEYTEDYVSRAEYVNYLMGTPRGPHADPKFPGLNVPVDLSFAFHTDAGITTGVVGTLSIHTIRDENRSETFPDGRSRMLNRDLGDIVQTQIVNDVRAEFTTQWTQRELMNRSYAESRMPNVPAILVEMLAHQNYDDMKFALDPRFRFVVARAMYKGMLRFLATEYGFEPVITPLAPDHLKAETVAPGRVRVSWAAVADPLEQTAKADGFILYRRDGDGGFDNGMRVKDATAEVTVPDAEGIYSFRVTAYNAGGESFPSETLAVRTGASGAKRALIVNAFDRICAPAMVTGPQREGVDRAADHGVGYQWSMGLTGDQYDFDSKHAWQGDNTPYTNDNPGHGASYADMETRQELGNTFDYTIRHGQAFADCGWAFDSVSDEALEASPAMLTQYQVVDWLLGKECTTAPPTSHNGVNSNGDKMKVEFQTWPAAQQKIVHDYLAGGGRLFASGAYVATDLASNPLATAADREFCTGTLRCVYIADHASRDNIVAPSVTDGPFKGLGPFRISKGLGEDGVYPVENAGAIEGLPKQKPACLRYVDGLAGAAVASDQGGGKRIVLGFPLECVIGRVDRKELLAHVLGYLEAKP